MTFITNLITSTRLIGPVGRHRPPLRPTRVFGIMRIRSMGLQPLVPVCDTDGEGFGHPQRQFAQWTGTHWDTTTWRMIPKWNGLIVKLKKMKFKMTPDSQAARHALRRVSIERCLLPVPPSGCVSSSGDIHSPHQPLSPQWRICLC